jgi:hypothetical protein
MARGALFAIALAVGLSGCGVAAKMDARQEYQASADAYKGCLVRNPASPANCEGLRLAMEADERKYTNLSAGLHPGSQGVANINIQSR